MAPGKKRSAGQRVSSISCCDNGTASSHGPALRAAGGPPKKGPRVLCRGVTRHRGHGHTDVLPSGLPARLGGIQGYLAPPEYPPRGSALSPELFLLCNNRVWFRESLSLLQKRNETHAARPSPLAPDGPS